MKFKRSYKLEVENIAQKYGFSTYTPFINSGYTVIHNSRHFNTRYAFGNWEDERIVQIHFDGSANNPNIDMQEIKVYRDGIEREIEPFIEEIVNKFHSGDKEPQGQLVATKVGHDTRCFGFNRRKIRNTI